MPPIWLSLSLRNLAHLPTCSCMSLRVFVSFILQPYGTLDTRSKPKLVILGHPLLFDNMLLWPFVCLTYLFALVWLSLIVPLFACFLSSCFFACLLACFLSHCMYTDGARTLGVKARLPRLKQKGQRCKQDVSPKREMFSKLGGLASLSCLLSLSLSLAFSRSMY